MLRPSANLAGCAFGAMVGVAVSLSNVWAPSRPGHSGFVPSLLGPVLTVVALWQLVLLVWRGGGLRRGQRRTHTALLRNGNTAWLGQTVTSRSTALEMWAINDDPPFPGVELIYSVRRLSPGPDWDPTEIRLPGRSSPPWGLRTRHARPRSCLFSDLVPGEIYEYGVSAAGVLRSPLSLRVCVVHTVSVRALVCIGGRGRLNVK